MKIDVNEIECKVRTQKRNRPDSSTIVFIYICIFIYVYIYIKKICMFVHMFASIVCAEWVYVTMRLCLTVCKCVHGCAIWANKHSSNSTFRIQREEQQIIYTPQHTSHQLCCPSNFIQLNFTKIQYIKKIASKRT